jgi:hypothetical protein
LLASGCFYVAGYAYGKHRGKLDTLKMFLADDDEPDWDAVFIEDGHLIMEEATQPRVYPPLTLIDGGKARPNRRKDQ